MILRRSAMQAETWRIMASNPCMSESYSLSIHSYHCTSVLIRRAGALQHMAALQIASSWEPCPPFMGKTFELQLLHYSPLVLGNAQDAEDRP